MYLKTTPHSMKKLGFLTMALVCAFASADAQDCDEAIPPSGLTSTYTPGTGILLQWTPVPFSVGMQINANTPSGASIARRLVGSELNQFLVPEVLLENGLYTWRIQAACSAVPPYNTTPISAASNFTIGTASTCPVSVLDADGNAYPVVEVAGRCVTAKNLAVRQFNDGSSIPGLVSDSAWQLQSGPGYCPVQGGEANTAAYGLLYNWHAVDNPAGLCPLGWHVPAQTEWFDVVTALGSGSEVGGQMKAIGTLQDSTGLWQTPNAGATNSSQLSVLPAGSRGSAGNYSTLLNRYAYLWSSTTDGVVDAFHLYFKFDETWVQEFDGAKANGMSVRCMQD